MAERRAQALALDRDLLRELLGAEELRDLLDADAVSEVERELRGRARTPDELHDLLLRRGDLRPGEFEEALAAELERERRAVRVRLAGERAAARRRGRGPLPRRARRDAARRATGRVPRGRGRPARLHPRPLRPRPRPVHDRRRGGALRARSPPCSRDSSPRSSGRAGSSAASCAPAARSGSGATRTSCGACAGRPWPGCARRSSRSSRPRSPASCRPGRASTAARALREALVPLQGLSLPVSLWESDDPAAARSRLPARAARPALRERRARLGGRGARARGASSTARTRSRSAVRRRCRHPRATSTTGCAPRSAREPCSGTTCWRRPLSTPRRPCRRCGTSSGPGR